MRWVHDVFGNCVPLVKVSGAARNCALNPRILMEHTPQAGPDLEIYEQALTYRSPMARTKRPISPPSCC